MGFVAFEPADEAITDAQDLGDHRITGKPEVEKNKSSADVVWPAPLEHRHHECCLLLEGLHAPFPPAAMLVELKEAVVWLVGGGMKAKIYEIEAAAVVAPPRASDIAAWSGWWCDHGDSLTRSIFSPVLPRMVSSTMIVLSLKAISRHASKKNEFAPVKSTDDSRTNSRCLSGRK